LTFENFEGHESELPIERDGFGFGVDKDAGASVVLRKPDRELQHEAEELLSQALPTRGLVDGETREAQDWYGVLRQLLAHCPRQVVDLELPRSDGCVSEDTSLVDRDVRAAEMVSKLVPPGVSLEKSVEVGVSRAKAGPIV
jgi:hypothetical protein